MQPGKTFPYKGAVVAMAAIAAVAAPPAVATPASVTLRVEGATSTIYEDQITTDGHDVTTAKGGTHPCDGTNGGANLTPGPTATAALDDAARIGGFTWDGSWFAFGDFLVDRVGPDTATYPQFWGLFLNYDFPSVGGCQQRVANGDDVLWAFEGPSTARALKLTGPNVARTDTPVPLTVTDGKDGAPQAGATVGGATTGPDGQATPVFSAPGVYTLKAEKSDSVRSNAIKICVDPPGIEACTTGDRTDPTARLLRLPVLLSDSSRSRTFSVAWDADDGPTGSGVAGYDLDARLFGGEFKGLLAKTKLTGTSFRGAPGTSYEFRVRAIDRAGHRSAPVVGSTLIPFDDRDKAVRFSRGWKRLARAQAWGKFVRRSARAGAVAKLSFQGTRVALVGRRLPRGGRLRVTVDGRSKIVRLRGRARFRSVLHRTAQLRPGRHSLRLTALDGSRPVELDAIAVSP